MTPQEYRQWFRTVEFFEGRLGWYFLSPHGLAVGPYGSERRAEQRAAVLAKTLRAVTGRDAASHAVVEFILRGC